jgi:hypothetical protein
MFLRRASALAAAKALRSLGRNRRVSQRYDAGGTAAVFAWQESNHFRTMEASLERISLGGVSALAECVPPAETPLWFRLRDDQTSDWVPATLVGAARTGRLRTGRHRVRMRFFETCPYDIFKAAIEGFSHESLDAEFANGGLKHRHGLVNCGGE